MTKKTLKEIAILAITKNMPDQTADSQQEGRLKRLYNNLDKEAIRLLGYYKVITAKDKKALDGKLTEWTKLTRWDSVGKHPVTVVSFLIGITSDNLKKDGKLLKILQDIFDYFDRNKKAYPACLVGGYSASQKFNSVFI